MARKKQTDLAALDAELVEDEPCWLGADRLKDADARAKSKFIAGLMNEGVWDKATSRQCVEEWGCTQNWVNQLASRASDYLNTTLGDREKMTGAVALRLREIMEQDGPDRIKATELVGKSLGMFRDRNTGTTPEQQRAHFIACIHAGEPSLMGALAEALSGASDEIREQVKEMCGYD